MPIVSKAQQRFMFAHQDDSGQLGKVANDFIQATPKDAYKSLPDRVGPAKPDYRTHVLAKLAKQFSQ